MNLEEVKTILNKHDLQYDRDYSGVGFMNIDGYQTVTIGAPYRIQIKGDGLMKIGDINETTIPEWFAFERSDDSRTCPPGLVDQFWKFRPALIEICERMELYDRNKEYTF